MLTFYVPQAQVLPLGISLNEILPRYWPLNIIYFSFEKNQRDYVIITNLLLPPVKSSYKLDFCQKTGS